MATPTRYDPFNDLARFMPLRELDDFFGMPRMRALFRDMPATEPQIRIDVTEDDKAYYVKADVPGVKKEDIDISIKGNQVSITAETRRESETRKGETDVRSERYYGMQSRTFTLMQEIDDVRAEAKSTDGVLNLTLPKKNAAPTRKLTVG